LQPFRKKGKEIVIQKEYAVNERFHHVIEKKLRYQKNEETKKYLGSKVL